MSQSRDERVPPATSSQLTAPLQDVFDLAESGTEYVIARHRDANVNLRTRFWRIIERAGLEVWPRIFQDLWSVRQTRLGEALPSPVVCDWLGNGEQVAAKHYLK